MPVPPRLPRFPVHAALIALLLACGASPAADRLPDDPLGHAMAGEFALQAGKLEDAARWYLQAARAEEGDAALAELTTRIALLAGDNAIAAQGLRLWRERAEPSPQLRAASATLALRQDRMRQARRELVALMRDEQGEGWRHALGVLATGSRSPDQSARLLTQLVRAGEIPAQLQAWLAFGGLAQRLDDGALQERIVAEVLKRFPGEPRVALLRASQLRSAGDRDGAREVLRSLHETATDSPALRLLLAQEYDALGELREAEAQLAKGEQDEQLYRLRASLLVRAEDNERLAALYEEVRRGASEPDPGRRMLLGMLAESLKRHDDALAWYRGVPGGPLRDQARMRAAVTLHELDRAAEAVADLHQLQADASAEDDTRRDAYLMEAELHARKGPAEAAEMDAFARGLGAFPDDIALLYSRALSWERRDDIPRAEADLRRILVIEPDNVAALNALGYTLADRTNRYREALELIDRARVAEPDNPAIIDSYGWVLYRLGRHEEALVELRRAFALMEDAEVAAHVAEVLWALGRHEEARKWFDTARGIDPEHRSLKRALEATGA
ncbi:MAG: tetratricopeptide repeat protein [Pseudoxanthomonas suwonensis]|nr:tetratricopeptide repeat protein [Pseudoxanthomonas suwonensis]